MAEEPPAREHPRDARGAPSAQGGNPPGQGRPTGTLNDPGLHRHRHPRGQAGEPMSETTYEEYRYAYPFRLRQHFSKAARLRREQIRLLDRKSTRLNSSHGYISYA